MKILAERIRQLREDKRLNQTQLGKLIGVGKNTISNYETEYSSPDNETLLKLADVLQVSTDYLLGKSDEKAEYIKKTSTLYDTELNEFISFVKENDTYMALAIKIKQNGIKPSALEALIDALIKQK